MMKRARKIVDKELSRRDPTFGYLWIAFGALIAAPPLVLLKPPYGVVVAASLVAGWLAFVGWRAARLTRAASLKGDRDYDRRTRHMLSAEYCDSESATAAKTRERRQPPPSPGA